MKIVVLEPDTGDAHTIRAVAQQFDWSIDWADNEDVAQQMIETGAYDLALLTLQKPVTRSLKLIETCNSQNNKRRFGGR